MEKRKSILVFVCMLIFFAGCMQIYLVLRMSMFDFSTVFLYGILFLMLWVLITAYSRRNKSLFISAALFMIACMCVKLSTGYIEDYHFQNTISKGNILKEDLKGYRKIHKVFPESLKDIYKKSHAPQYNIGLLRYHFMYHKTDTSYKIYFNHFEGRMFVNYGESDVWNFYD